jgi:tRNA A-37 threonylcarbamoyl transferase component Bud32
MKKQQYNLEEYLKKARNNWLITDEYDGTEAAEFFQNLDKVFACSGEKAAADPISQVIKTAVAGKYFYVKRYYAAGKKLRRYLGKSRIRAEWENLLTFANLGVPTPKIVGFGQAIEFGQFKRGALITEEIADSVDLRILVRNHPEVLQDKTWRLSVIEQIADYTRILHEAGYVHGNLNWRNILVTLNGEPKVYFFDCPAGGLRQGLTLQKEKLRDLAFLDKLARIHLKATDQLRFFKRYRRITTLATADKRDIGLIIRRLDKHRQRQQLKQAKKKGANHG